jgi:hypothetical protein
MGLDPVADPKARCQIELFLDPRQPYPPEFGSGGGP